jgi:hypothetical protein
MISLQSEDQQQQQENYSIMLWFTPQNIKENEKARKPKRRMRRNVKKKK